MNFVTGEAVRLFSGWWRWKPSANAIMTIPPLHKDFLDFLRCLAENSVKYLLVGGYAVNYYGYHRSTGDIDFWYERSEPNARRIVKAISDFGFADSGVTAENLLEEGRIVMIGREPLRIDLMHKISGCEFKDAYQRKTSAQIMGIPVEIIGREDLLKNKSATTRGKDKLDVEKLSEEPAKEAKAVVLKKGQK